ncbi:Diaminopimelate decarboxylase 1-like [Homarus americanus]|uniref:Diaminopimelate decarboxylase 1-like n=1 Tax=Homarus americanus TaxID=6706 RepID=A0A8J5K1H6_HOMAM|nr:Diaminopimelate decarboxylase 1-like [Homarus americanus]
MSLERLREHLRQEFGHLSSPAFVYSSATLHSSVLRYKDALTPLLVNVARELGVRARALVRLNPALDAHTHPYLATALADSKFGVEVDQIRDSGWQKASMINLGGGLSVSYEPPIDGGYHQEETIPTSLINPTSPLSSKKRITPETTKGVVMTEVMGVKTNAGREFVVVDAAMTEVIRPALYGVHHPICYVTTPSAHQEVAEVDVVGPVCESGDFLARRCFLPRPSASGDALVVWAAGAYCASMASNYNLRPHALEVLVHSPDSYKVLRRPQEFEDLVREFL